MNAHDRFRDADPARHIEPLSTTEKREIAQAAVAGQVTLELPTASSRRKFLAAAAVVALVGGLGLLNSLPGSGNSDRLVLTAASGGGAQEAAGNAFGGGLAATDAKLSSSIAIWFGGYKFVADNPLSTTAGKATAYSVTTLSNAREIADSIRSYLQLPQFTQQDLGVTPQDAAGTVSSSDYLQAVDGVGADQRSLYAQISPGGAWSYFGYYNSKIDPWHDCNLLWQDVKTAGSSGTSSSGGGATAEPAPVDPVPSEPAQCLPTKQTKLPSASSAKSQLVALLAKFGLPSTGLSFNVSTAEELANNNQVWVNAELQVEGASVGNWSASFVDAGLLSFSGSLTEVKQLGDYDVLSPAAALDRLNQVNEQQRAAWEANQGSAVPMPAVDTPVAIDKGGSAGSGSATGGSTGTDPGLSPEPVPTEGVIEPGPGPVLPTVQTVHVTRVERTLIFAMDAQGRGVWVPGYSFYGYVEGESQTTSEYPMGQVIAVVDDQFDVAAYYGSLYGGGMLR